MLIKKLLFLIRTTYEQSCTKLSSFYSQTKIVSYINRKDTEKFKKLKYL